MVEIKGKPALLVIDMQNGFVHPNGTFGKLGLMVTYHPDVIQSITRLVQIFKSCGLPVIFTRLVWKADYSDCGLLTDTMPQIKDLGGFVRDSWDAEVVDKLKHEASMTIDKTRNSAFFKTGLEEKLRDLEVGQVIVAGVGTNVCVESTVRDAFTLDFHTVVVSDATATLTKEMHEASLTSMQWFGGSATTSETEEALRATTT